MSYIANSNIRVDNFQYRSQDKTHYTYFLSHCHEGKFNLPYFSFIILVGWLIIAAK